MSQIKNLLFGLFFILCTHVYGVQGGATAYTLMTQGNEAFEKNDYKTAIDFYEKSLGRNQSLEQHLNLGNAYYHDRQKGKAILHYLRALAISPGDADVETNLAVARKSAHLVAPDLNKLQAFAFNFSENTWALIGMTAFWIMAGSLVFSKVYQFKKVPCRLIFSLATAIVLMCGTALYAYFKEHKLGVVVAKDTPLLVAPADSSPSNAILPEGTLGYVEKERKGFYFIKTQQKREGWVSHEQFELVRNK